jgi:hypothetical protein
MIPVVVLAGPYANLTLASLKFSYWGKSNQADIRIVDTWVNGFNQFHNGLVLFVKAGTVFTDFIDFIDKLKNYPHNGLIGHLVAENNNYYLDDQCFLLDVEKFSAADFSTNVHNMVNIERSESNIHHDYTPLWIRRKDGEHLQHGNFFGTRLIDRQLRSGKIAVNWKQHLRENKKVIYNQSAAEIYLASQLDYLNLAKNQLWLLNNEPIFIEDHESFIGPASGLFWIFNAAFSKATVFDIVDISLPQINLAKILWETWDGINYGTFVANNIDLRLHYQLDDPNLSEIEKLKLKRKDRLAKYLQDRFDQLCPDKHFESQWKRAKLTKTLKFYNIDLLDYIKSPISIGTKVWKSNVDDYKYTLLMHEYEKIKEFLHWIELT